MQNLPLGGFLVGQHHVRVHGRVVLAVRVENLGGRENGIQPKRAGLIRDDRHNILADRLVPHQVLNRTHQSLGGRNLLLA